MDHLWDLLSKAGVAKTAVISAAIVLLVFGVLTWATIPQETINIGWPIEISAPESEQMKACRTIQAAVHDEIETLENERASTYKTIDNDQNAFNEETRLRLDAIERDRSIQKETGSSGYNENAVMGRIKQLESEIDYKNEIAEGIRQTIADRSETVYSSCAVIINARR